MNLFWSWLFVMANIDLILSCHLRWPAQSYQHQWLQFFLFDCLSKYSPILKCYMFHFSGHYWCICPEPMTTNLVVVSSRKPMGPKEWNFLLYWQKKSVIRRLFYLIRAKISCKWSQSERRRPYKDPYYLQVADLQDNLYHHLLCS